MVLEDLQFTTGIAIRCVLHRYTSRDIHRQGFKIIQRT